MKKIISTDALAICASALFAAAVHARAGAAQFVTYEQFGAKGDGKTDDRAAIVAAHDEANRRGAPVKAKDGAVYYVKSDDGTAVIKTDVDFGKAKFIIDDTEVKKLNSPLFAVKPDRDEFKVKDVKSLARGQKSIGVSLPCRCVVHVKYDGVKRYIRFGLNQNSGTAQQEILVVGKDGKIDASTPLLWDYPGISAMTAYPMDEKTLTVKGGEFTTVANRAESKYRYHNRGFSVNRSNVRIEGIRHLVTGEQDHGAPYGGFLNISHCASVVVTGCTFSAHKTYTTIGSAKKPVPMGSYDLSVNNAADISFLDSRQLTDIKDSKYWGLFGSNYCKNLLFDGCEFSRFDAHMGVANATILNSKLGYMGIHMIGFGTFRVENTTVYSDYFFDLRQDYGSTWDGDVVVKNCRFVPPAKCWQARVFMGSNSGMHDFGYGCTMPETITIDGLTIDDSACAGKKSFGPYLFCDFNPKMKDGSYVEKFPYKTTKKVILKNVKTSSGRELLTSPNSYMFRNTEVVNGR